MAPPSPPPPPPPPPSSTALPIMNLLLRIFTFLLLLASLIILTTNTVTLSLDIEYLDTEDLKFRFKDVYAYRYMLFTILIGIVHSLLQIAFAIYHVSTGKRLISSNGLYQFDFYGDKVISYILATGAAASFGATIDLKSVFEGFGLSVDKFFNMASASASLLLIGFVCSAISSVFSSFALPKND